MTSVYPAISLSLHENGAVLFELDSVLPRTASVHTAAWKRLVDGFLEQRAFQVGEPFVTLDIATDYPPAVDATPRCDGAAAFLESHSIELPLGSPEDGPGVPSVRALGNLKNRCLRQQMEQHGVEGYEAASPVSMSW